MSKEHVQSINLELEIIDQVKSKLWFQHRAGKKQRNHVIIGHEHHYHYGGYHHLYVNIT